MLPIAKILKSDGTDGGVLVGLRGIGTEEIDSRKPVFIEFDGLPVPFFVLSVRKKGSARAVLYLNDVVCLKDAEELVGREICIEGEAADEDDLDFTGWTLLNRGKRSVRSRGWNRSRAISASMSATPWFRSMRIS